MGSVMAPPEVWKTKQLVQPLTMLSKDEKKLPLLEARDAAEIIQAVTSAR